MPTSYWSEKKYGTRSYGGAVTEHRLRRRRTLVERIGPVLDANARP